MTSLAAISLTSPPMLWGLAASSLPFVAHLMNRRARQRITFPTIRFLRDAVAGQSRLFRFRRWLLLLLRCLAVTAIAAAFARPVWSGAASPGHGASHGSALVIVIDASASTAQRPGGVPLFKSMTAAAQRLLTDEPRVVAANVIYAGARPHPAFSDLAPNLDAVVADLAAAEPTQDHADLRATIALASDMLERRPGPRRLALLSDMQRTNWDDLISSDELAELAHRDIRFSIASPPVAHSANLALSRPRSLPARPIVDQPARLVVTVTNFSDRRQTAAVSLTVDDASRPGASVSLDPWQRLDVSLETTFQSAMDHRVVFGLPDDDLAADNAAYLVVAAVRRVPVALIADDDPADPTGSGYYITRALAPRIDDPGIEVRRIHAAQVTADSLRGVEAIIIGQADRLTDSSAMAIRDYIAAGGGVLMFCGDGPVTANALALQRTADPAAPLLPWTPAVVRDLAAEGRAASIPDGAWDSPALAAFDEASRQSLARVRFDRLYAAGVPAAGAVTLLRFDDGTPALSSERYKAGRLLLAAFNPAPRWGDLVKHGSFVALVHSLVDDLRPSSEANRPYTVGQPLNVPNTLKDPATLRLIDSSSRAIPLPDRIRTAGFYTIRRGDETLSTFAANIDERESDLRSIDPETLKRVQFNGESATTAGGSGPFNSHDSRPLWPWLVFGAMGLFALEMALIGAWKR